MSFEVNETVSLSGSLPDGSHYSTVIKTAGVVALIVMKAHALRIREKTKDAYDVWFCRANYPGNIANIAKAFKPHVGKASVITALDLLSEKFKSIDARGPMDVVKEDGSLDPEYRLFLRQDAFQRVQTLINSI